MTQFIEFLGARPEDCISPEHATKVIPWYVNPNQVSVILPVGRHFFTLPNRAEVVEEATQLYFPSGSLIIACPVQTVLARFR